MNDDPCYLCGFPSREMDHMPVSAALGGTATLPICRGCHDAKDRFPLDMWNPSLAFTALSGVWAKATRDERIVLVKMFHIANMQAAELIKRLP